MNYPIYQAYFDMMEAMRAFTQQAFMPLSQSFLLRYPGMREFAAAWEVMANARVTHTRPDFSLASVCVGDGNVCRVPVHEQAVHVAPFGTLLRFSKEGMAGQPRVLIVAPLSGHFATRMRETMRTMLADHEVYITDWHNARDVPLSAGRFGLDEYIRYLITFLEAMGPGAHVVAICQSCVAALAAAALMAEDEHPAQPRSLTLIAGPVDARINPTSVNQFASNATLEWLERNFISTVPAPHRGAGRRVYPGFMQLMAFMNIEPERHIDAFAWLYEGLIEGDLDKANAMRTFYEEYLAVQDLTAEFYLETTRHVFQEHALPSGKLKWCGRSIDPAAIRRTALLTVEGERDEICGIGQTLAAHKLCRSIPASMKFHYLQAGGGHESAFTGRRWSRQIYPLMREVIRQSSE